MFLILNIFISLFIDYFIHLYNLSICHSRVAGRTRETRGEVNKQSFNDEHRIHYHIDELTDQGSGKTQGL